MYTLDTSIFIRDIDPNEPEHQVCHALLEVLDRENIPVIVPNLLLAEVAASVSRTRRDPIRARIAAAAIAAFSHIQLIVIDDVIAQEAADLAADRALRGADAMYVAIARHYGCILVSLDREQRERATRVVPTQTPAEALSELSTDL